MVASGSGSGSGSGSSSGFGSGSGSGSNGEARPKLTADATLRSDRRDRPDDFELLPEGSVPAGLFRPKLTADAALRSDRRDRPDVIAVLVSDAGSAPPLGLFRPKLTAEAALRSDRRDDFVLGSVVSVDVDATTSCSSSPSRPCASLSARRRCCFSFCCQTKASSSLSVCADTAVEPLPEERALALSGSPAAAGICSGVTTGWARARLRRAADILRFLPAAFRASRACS